MEKVVDPRDQLLETLRSADPASRLKKARRRGATQGFTLTNAQVEAKVVDADPRDQLLSVLRSKDPTARLKKV